MVKLDHGGKPSLLVHDHFLQLSCWGKTSGDHPNVRMKIQSLGKPKNWTTLEKKNKPPCISPKSWPKCLNLEKTWFPKEIYFACPRPAASYIPYCCCPSTSSPFFHSGSWRLLQAGLSQPPVLVIVFHEIISIVAKELFHNHIQTPFWTEFSIFVSFTPQKNMLFSFNAIVLDLFEKNTPLYFKVTIPFVSHTLKLKELFLGYMDLLYISLLYLFCWTILLHLGTQLPSGRFAPPRPPNSDLGGRDALPWHPWRYPTPQPTKKLKMCHVVLLLKFPGKNGKWQLHTVSLYSSQSLTANWSLEIGCQRMISGFRGGGQTLGGAHFSVWNLSSLQDKNLQLAYGLWLQIRVSKTEHWLVRIIDVVFTVGVIHFFWRGARPGSIPGQSSLNKPIFLRNL